MAASRSKSTNAVERLADIFAKQNDGLAKDQREARLAALDGRSLNNYTFQPDYVLMGYALPEEAQRLAVHRTGTAQAGLHPQVSKRRETAYAAGGNPVGFSVRQK